MDQRGEEQREMWIAVEHATTGYPVYYRGVYITGPEGILSQF